MNSETAAALSLLNAGTVRTRAHILFDVGLDDRLPHFRVHLDKLEDVANLVIATTRKNYPSLNVPFHARWRHFFTNGVDRYAPLAARASDAASRARAAFDLVILSVLLDAGAGAQWRYRDPATGADIGRSEGLALASLDMFAAGAFTADAKDRLRADADALAKLDTETLAKGFQVAPENPLVGLDGRAELLRALGRLVASRSDVFGQNDSCRPGGFFDHLTAKADNGAIPAPLILSELLLQFGPIWPSRLTLGGLPLGDCWRHPSLVTADATNGLVPLHKLSQWLAYSLIEPLQQAGFTVTDIDGLTGLAEYRNGGLFVDTGMLTLRNEEDVERAHDVSSPLVVEWRALTVALLDRLAEMVRAKLNKDTTALPLASILEGGTWAAGRAIAFSRRPDGASPIKVVSDGTVF
ncbi:MAG TPA: URC4/urg3 family protein [Xanthobacteraceae bacterium]|jgi:hypothetical protein|nr:URC4/urg3 family protein [Xanthobacteraceae bacterium]